MVKSATTCGVVLLLCVVVHCNYSHAYSSYDVGDEEGWSYDASAWPLDKNFKAGDVLVFKYEPLDHNVVVVSTEQAYDSCTVPPGSGIYNTGLDQISLKEGYNYFISSIGQDCQNGFQMLVYAEH